MFRIFRFGIIATVHDVESLDKMRGNKSNKKYRKFSKIIDRIIVHNEFTRAEVMRIITDYDPNRIHLVPTTDLDFINKENISRSDARKALGIDLPEGSQIVLFFGQIKDTKGLDVLIRAFSMLEAKDTFLLIAGRCWKTDMIKYHKLIDDLNIRDRTIVFEKYIENRDVMRLYKASDIAVLPYLKVYNSSVLIRGMDYGAVNIVSDLDFFTGIIKDGQNGLIFKSGDIIDLRSVMSGILKNRSLYEKIRKNSVDFVKQNYSFEVSGAETKNVYMKALSPNRKIKIYG